MNARFGVVVMLHSAKLQPISDDLNPSSLTEMVMEAKKRRFWYRLSRLERGILNLTVRCVEKPKSRRLINVLTKIVAKIKEMLISPFQRLMEKVGRPLAEKRSIIAKSWGNKEAGKWAEDLAFIMYLTITHASSRPSFIIVG